MFSKKREDTKKMADALAIFNYFKKKEGSEHIATPLSIYAVRNLGEKAKSILEIGAGIGTLTYTLLQYSKAKLHIYEDNLFCIEELKKNLQQFEGRYVLLTSYTQKPLLQNYDLVIVDGGNGQEHDGGYKQFIFELFAAIHPGVVYIEGIRRPQRKMIRDALHGRHAFRVKKIPYAGEHKGGTLYCCYRAPRIVEELQYRFNELREHPRLEKYFCRIKPPKSHSQKKAG